MNEAFELALALLVTLPGMVASSRSWLTQSQGPSPALSTLVSLSVERPCSLSFPSIAHAPVFHSTHFLLQVLSCFLGNTRTSRKLDLILPNFVKSHFVWENFV